jgi:hypothetical protein
MSLAFALMAAINGSTGSSATLSHGLKGTKPHRRRSDGSTILIPHRRRRKPSRPLSHKSVARVAPKSATSTIAY